MADVSEPGDGNAEKLPAQRRPARPPKIPDADRERLIEVLQKAAGDGTLTLDEFAERAEMVWAAATSMELEAVVADLPQPVAATPTQPMVGEARRRKIRRWLVAVMSGSSTKGRWRVGESVHSLAIMGGVEIDLREAEFDAPELTIHAVAIMGGIDIIVPEGIEVDMDAFAIMGGKDMKLASVPILPGAPRVRVTGFALMGGIGVRSRKHPGELAAAREARRQAERERRELRRAERGDRQRGRGRDRLDLPVPPVPPLGGDRRDFRREVRRTIHEHVLEQIEDNLSERRGARRDERQRDQPVRNRDRDRWATTADDAAAVRRRLQRNGRPEGTVTIVFTDIEDSTQWISRLGDSDAALLVKEHNELVRAQVAAHGGYEVKFRGDGFMLAFTSASRGVRCAIALQQEMKHFADKHPEAPLRIRVGINSGEAVNDGNDFLGTAVNIAARLTDAAMGGEVLVSSVVRDLVSSTGEFRFEDEQSLALKGIDAPQRACLVAWT